MQQRSGPSPGLSRRSNDVMYANSNPCNGDVKLVEFKLQRFPWATFITLWSISAFLATVVPYLAKTIPPTYRTDIKWWMSGIVYQLPAPNAEQQHYFKDFANQVDDLHALGITAVRMSNFFKMAPDGGVVDYLTPNPAYGSMDDLENIINILATKEMRLIIDVPTTHTSTAHVWFDEDRQHRSRDSVYVWTQTPHDDDYEHEGETYWSKDNTRHEHYRHTKDSLKSAMINYSTHVARNRMQSVLGHWLQRGVTGFVLLDYDKIVFREGHDQQITSHVQFDQQKVEQLQNLANLTRTMKRFLSDHLQVNDPDEPNDILLAVDISWQDDNTWHALYDAGADLILNQDFIMSKDDKITGDINPFELRQQVRSALTRVPRENTHNWRICDENTSIESHDRANTQNLVNMVQLLLPGAAFVCDGQLPQKQNSNITETTEHFHQMAKWRLTSAMSWGETQLSYVDKNMFSFVRYAFGKMYPRYIIIANIGSHPHRHNFTMVREGLVVPDLGTLRYVTCPENDASTDANDGHVINSLIYLNDTVVQPRCGLLVELKLKLSI